MARLSKGRRLIFAAAATLILLIGAELILRVHDFGFYYNFGADILGMPLLDMHRIRRIQNRTVEHDPHLFWRFKPDQTLDAHGIYRRSVTINSRGFRGPDFKAEKPAGAYRIACIGDSTTFGWSVGDNETYAFYLGEALNKNCGGGVEALNLGVTGYTSFQGMKLAELYVKDWAPDLVVFAFGPNDRLPALKSDREHFESRTWEIGEFQLLLHRFQVYKLMKSGVIYLKNRARGLSLDPQTYIPRLKRKVGSKEYADNARIVKTLCDRTGADLILVHVDYPSLPEDHVSLEIKKQADERGAKMPADWKRWDGAALHRELSGQLEVPAIDLRELFEQASGEDNEWRAVMVDNGHPNGRGHKIIAEELARLIKPLPAFQERCREAAP
jgi:lysophospholipase L1-like esterase